MKYKKTGFIICLFFCALFCIPLSLVHADDDHKERKKESRQKKNKDDTSISVAANPVYKSQCSACHLAYPPQLLPAASWKKLLAGLEDHFGESLDLDEDSKRTVSDYLISNSADHRSSETAEKIMKCLKNDTPLRITKIPCIAKEHHDLPQEIYTRPAIGSFSNCTACHTAAEEGNFDDDTVKIPL